MKTKEVVDMALAFNDLVTLDADEKSVRLKYAIALNTRAIDGVYKAFADERASIIRKYSDDGVLKPTDEHYNEAVAEIDALLEQEVGVTIPVKMKLSWLEGVSGVTERMIMSLLPILEETNDESEDV